VHITGALRGSVPPTWRSRVGKSQSLLTAAFGTGIQSFSLPGSPAGIGMRRSPEIATATESPTARTATLDGVFFDSGILTSSAPLIAPPREWHGPSTRDNDCFLGDDSALQIVRDLRGRGRAGTRLGDGRFRSRRARRQRSRCVRDLAAEWAATTLERDRG